MSFPAETARASDAPTTLQGQPQPTKVASSLEALGSVPQPAPVSVPPVESVTDDIALAPTQILSPKQMMAYHTRRWQEELEREQPEAKHVAEQGPVDIAEAPTKLIPPPDASAPQTPAEATTPGAQAGEDDIALQPTVAMPPVTGEVESAPPAAQSAQQEPSASPADTTTPASSSDATLPGEVSGTQTPADVSDMAHITNGSDKNIQEAEVSSAEATASTSSEEDVMEQTTGPTEGQNNQDQATEGFPVLAVGTTVGTRYEVTQVSSSAEDEHVYQVTDHQGYQHCWNCGSEENAEGDEFCIDCGAELTNASYIMHEYPASESKDNESHVLQGVIVNTLMEQGNTYVIEQPQAAQIVFPNGVHLLASSSSDAGMVRRGEPNEDSTLVLLLERVHESVASPAGIFVVADGMGGHDNGQGASRMTINIIAERIVHELLMPPLTTEEAGKAEQGLDEDNLVTLVHGAVEDANTALCQANQRDKSDMGSTLTGFMMVGDHAYIFNVGDSRTYMLRDGNLYQLTNDHSLVGQLVAGGLIEPDDVYTHPQRSQIYRSIGDKLNVQIDIFKQQVHPGDILLSCSDGLWEMVRNPQITDILNNALDPQTACTQLIEAANANGGEDNVSAVVVFVR
ncbi:MAG: protein phosphatase 2C domain-containing protein [Chloroflexi bacterium]|nr:protein phosphatase 2C domain-containing protein [Chloroflexota bacterium]